MVFRLFFLVIIFFLAIFVQDKTPNLKEAKRPLSPPRQIKYFTLGYNDFLASSLWIRVLQDLEFCEEGKFSDEDFVLPSANEKNQIKGILDRKMKPSKCHKGWVFSMLDVLTEVQPRFALAYDVGATMLSVAVDDREGARIMFEKGLKQYPKSWELNFKAGYHYLWEIQDSKRSTELLNESLKNGGPPIIAALVAALYSHLGQAQIAKMVLEDTLAQKPTGLAAERIKYRLEQVNKILSESNNK